jgi:glycosyltransferase involved in cell wall biosynthesis
MKIVFVFRSKKLGYHSIENVFDIVRNELADKIEVEALYVPHAGFRLSNIFWLKNAVKSNGPDAIYHVTGDIHYVVFGLPRKNTILTIHDCVFVKRRKGLVGWVIKKIFLDWPVKYVPIITAISQKTKGEIMSLTTCDANKIRVISNPIGQHFKNRYKSFQADKPVLLFIGSLPNKNLNRVIEAINGFKCILNIVGEVQEYQRTKLEQYNIQYQIESHISNEEMAYRYERADIIMFPSLYEGFGLPVIEGFKVGRAVLTSNLSPMKDLADGAAWLVDPYSVDSIRKTLHHIVSDTELRNKKIENGSYVCQQYTAASVAAEYYRAYSELQSRNEVALAS